MPGLNNQTIAGPCANGDNLSLIEVHNVSRQFGSVTAVSDVTLMIKAGDICGLVGSDGAGKTTLLRMVATMIRPTGGSIFVDVWMSLPKDPASRKFSAICPNGSVCIKI